MTDPDDQSAPDTADTSGEGDVGAMPEATAEAPQLIPGGADSLDDPKYGDTPGDPVPRDLDPSDNPAVDHEEVPDEIKQPDDKQQEPSDGDEDLDAGETGESEPPA
ncbi:hypothetical protein [Nocardioides jensenii]|uniref:hypothetical protein n=1 Tax=Nocardioides jensenii TaxID=1843 RepID=UPI00082D156D|nr:hypothetical protein [Nocardioides jensenii]